MPTKAKPSKDLRQILTLNSQECPEDAIGFWMWRLTLVFQRRAETELKKIGLTHLQFVVLKLAGWLSLQGGEVSQSGLTRVSGVQEAQLSLMVKALKAKKLITQQRSIQNTRARVVALTPAGVQMLERAVPLMAAVQEEMWPPGGETDRMRQLFAQTLKRWEAERA